MPKPRAECELFQKNLLIFDITAKRRKKHKIQISGLVNSMRYKEQKSQWFNAESQSAQKIIFFLSVALRLNGLCI
jgi:hypothetical protein